MSTGPKPALLTRVRATLAFLATVAIVVTGVTAVGVTAASAAETGSVSGLVFRDFNQNGAYDTGAAALSGVANDRGLAGVTVTAYDANNQVFGSTTTAAGGTYTISGTNAVSTKLRVQFSAIPAGYKASAVSGSGAGTRNNTTVQFVTLGSAGATDVNLGVNAPEDYSQAAAPVMTAIQYAGAPIASNSASSSASLVATPYTAGLTGYTNSTATFPSRVTLATFLQTGAVWGSAFRNTGNDVFLAATYKRHSGLGALGLGGIYRVTNVLSSTGAVNPQPTSAVTNWLDVTTLGVNLGTAESNATRALTTGGTPAYDIDAFAKAGKVGIGSMATSADGKTLYFINLFDKKMYAIDISNIAAPVLLTPNGVSLGLTTGERPWALTLYRDKAYVGYVTTGETLVGGVETANPGQSATTAAMTARVITAPISSLLSGPTWTSVLNGNLGYPKGDVYGNVLSGAQFNGQSHQWNSWTDTWNWPASGTILAGSVGEPITGTATGWQIYPEPILSGLYFDAAGYLTLGFTDRNAVQGGNRNLPAVAGATTHFETGASGDILIAAPNAAQSSWTLESAGVAGGRTAPAAKTVTVGATNYTFPDRKVDNQGPTGGEFYNDRLNNGSGGTHQETALGALAGIRGTNEVVTSSYDPLAGIRLSGTSWLSTTNGDALAGYEHTIDPGGATTSPAAGTFQKGGGLGAVQLLAQVAPIEIGNRVWFDADQNGRQDADEPALAGVTVDLIKSGTTIATRTTDAAGNYYFSSDSASAYYAAGFTAGGGDYTVKFTTPTTGNVTLGAGDTATFGTLPWNSLSLTTAGAAASDIDSNPGAAGTYVYTAGLPGVDDHTIDAGYKANVYFTVSKVISSAGGTPDAGQTFTVVPAATDFRGAALDLGAASPVTLTGGQSSSAIAVPAGTSVKVTENSASSYRNVTVSPSASTLVTGSSTAPFAFTVTNELFKPGAFSIAKTVTGAAAGSVASGQAFTLNYTYSGLATPGTLVVHNDGIVETSGPIPHGAVVTVTEQAPTGAPADVKWQTPKFSGTGVTDNGNGSATFTAGDGTTTAISLENPTTKLFGSFSITKVIGSDAAASVPGNFPFTVQYSTNNGTSWTDLTVSKNSPTQSVANLPAGTEVLIREVAPGAAAPDVEFGTPVFSGNVTTGADGVTRFTVVADQTLAVTLTNPTTRLFGQFSVTKDVTGGGAAVLTPGHTFTVGYSYPGTTGNFTLEDGQSFTSGAIPAGTNVTITEVTPTGGLPAGATWGTPVLQYNGTQVANGSTITIGSKSTLAIVLANPTQVTPSVSIEKGDGTGTTIAHDADTSATAATYTPGSTRTIVFTVTNDGTDALREVTLGDTTLSGPGVSGLTWTLPDGSPLAATPTATGWTAPWAATFGAGGVTWKPGEVITGTATLTLPLSAAPHADRASVTATGVYSGATAGDTDNYYALAGAVQVIEYDGNATDPAIGAPGAWITPTKPLADAAADANTPATAVVYPVGAKQEVRWVVTNTGTTALTNLTLTDATTSGPAITADWTADLSAFGGSPEYSFIDDGPFPGILPPGASFFATGHLTLPANSVHADAVTIVGTIVTPATDANGVPTNQPAVDGSGAYVVAKNNGNPVTVTDNDPFNAKAGVGPFVDIQEGDGTGTTIAHEADTMATGEFYTDGQTRTIIFRVTNTGDENLREVTFSDTLVSGGDFDTLSFTLPNGDVIQATKTPTGWTAPWTDTFGAATAKWLPGEVVIGRATLTVTGSDAPHVDKSTVTATGAASAIAVTDTDPYNAYTGGIQVIEYDGAKADPNIGGPGAWVIPAKPLADASQDANTPATAVEYTVDTPRVVRWVVTNTTSTSLTNVTLTDATTDGAAIGSGWTADLRAFGGPENYSFVDDGPFPGVIPPGASFFATGSLSLAANATHADTITAGATVVVPEVNGAGVPTGNPSVDVNGDPITATKANGDPVIVTDADPFHAYTGDAPAVDIEIGDGQGSTIDHDADTMTDGVVYAPGSTRTIISTVTNTGDEALREVTITDQLISGQALTSLVFTLPNGDTLVATQTATGWTAVWPGTFGGGTATWGPDEVITGTATLTVGLTDEPHVDRASVTATGVSSGIGVDDSDDYNAYTGGIQVIKYDGDKADPAVGTLGAWVTPAKPLADASQDANAVDDAVIYPVDTEKTVTWVVTNTGTTSLTTISLKDLTNVGPAVGGDWTADLSAFGGPDDYSFTDEGDWAGILPPGASFFARGALELGANQSHSDTVSVVGTIVVPAAGRTGVPTGSPQLDGNGNPVTARDSTGGDATVSDEDTFNARTGNGPRVDIEKYDSKGDADTMVDAQVYNDGDSRTITLKVKNTGDEKLREVTLTDDLISGRNLASLVWTLPNGDTLTATKSSAGWTARWNDTFGAGTATWKPGQVITGKATLKVLSTDEPHVDRASVTAVGAESGIPVTDKDDYNAITGAVQVIKYDAADGDPVLAGTKGTKGTKAMPSKFALTPTEDADSSATAAKVAPGTKKTIRWVVTNTGTTYLTHLMLTDVTLKGAAVGSDWTADLTPIGGPKNYSFVKDGPWDGLFAPGQSFYSEGTLTMNMVGEHQDRVDVDANVVVPATDSTGKPTGQPLVSNDGTPVIAKNQNGNPFSVASTDAFTATADTVLASTGLEAQAPLLLAAILFLSGLALMFVAPRRRRKH